MNKPHVYYSLCSLFGQAHCGSGREGGDKEKREFGIIFPCLDAEEVENLTFSLVLTRTSVLSDTNNTLG